MLGQLLVETPDKVELVALEYLSLEGNSEPDATQIKGVISYLFSGSSALVTLKRLRLQNFLCSKNSFEECLK